MINDSKQMFPSDGRDYFEEIVGKNGYKQNLNLSQMIKLIPDFIYDYVETNKPSEVIGKFHLN